MGEDTRTFLAGADHDPAIVSGRGTMTFGALRLELQGLADTLFCGSGKHLVFTFLPNSVGLVTLYLGALVGGHAIGLFPPSTPLLRARRLVRTYRPEVVVIGFGESADFLQEIGYEPVSGLFEDDPVRVWTSPLSGEIAPELAVLLSTSGSTGSPKLVRLSAANVAANATAIVDSLGIRSWERAVTGVPLCYAYGLSVLNSHLAAGSAVVVTDRTPLTSAFWNIIAESGVTSLAGTPMIHRAIVGGAGRSRLPATVRVMTQAGGRLPPDVARSALEWTTQTGGRFYCMYGQTEATSRITCLPASRLADKLGSVGLALPGGRVVVGPPANGGPDGLISYTGPNVMMGYATSRGDLMRGHDTDVLETGDVGRLDDDGFLYVTGRSARFVKLLDHRVSLDDVEEWFQSAGSSAVVAAYVAGSATIVVFTEDRSGCAEAVRRAAAGAVGVPKSTIVVHRVEAIPQTANGKVDYATLEREAARLVNRGATGR
jgi:acyl-CoA synthetase (AMP-forming)/AMP-acid ligase II